MRAMRAAVFKSPRAQRARASPHPVDFGSEVRGPRRSKLLRGSKEGRHVTQVPGPSNARWGWTILVAKKQLGDVWLLFLASPLDLKRAIADQGSGLGSPTKRSWAQDRACDWIPEWALKALRHQEGRPQM